MKRMLVVVDYQKDFVDGSLGFKGAEVLDKGIAKKVKEYLDNDDIVIVTKDTHSKGYLNTREGKALPVEHCIYGTEGHCLYGETGKILNDNRKVLELTKNSFGLDPNDMHHLSLKYRSENIEYIELVGLVTNICVLSNAVMFQATYPSVDILVDAKLCSSFDSVLHEKTLDVLEGLQVKVDRG